MHEIPYLSLVVLKVIGYIMDLISHLEDDYLRVTGYLYAFDLSIQLVSESLHKCLILSNVVGKIKFQVACEHHFISMGINEKTASACSFLIPGTIKV